mmetsp:Transcript_14947/g.45255  ORF Transcript_14947/g.45255 Transcript_14947/m.45255 type:complete len:241 (+) Transcript_14947:750-1472(+)
MISTTTVAPREVPPSSRCCLRSSAATVSRSARTALSAREIASVHCRASSPSAHRTRHSFPLAFPISNCDALVAVKLNDFFNARPSTSDFSPSRSSPTGTGAFFFFLDASRSSRQSTSVAATRGSGDSGSYSRASCSSSQRVRHALSPARLCFRTRPARNVTCPYRSSCHATSSSSAATNDGRGSSVPRSIITVFSSASSSSSAASSSSSSSWKKSSKLFTSLLSSAASSTADCSPPSEEA